LSLPEDKFILLTVRNLVSRMGLENFIHSLRQASVILPGIHAVIGGEGPLKERLMSLTRDLGVANIVTFAGFIPDGELPDYYRAADLFILPTLELEGFGLVTLEAMATGLPVLGTPIGGTLEILERLDERYLFDDTSPEAITRRITEIGRQYLENPDVAREASLRCRTFVEENYSWKRNVDMVEDLFRGLCGC
jgi:glycosyltransferase involved in cell wall biosynthesis